MLFVLRRVQSAQQFQALQAQYSGAFPTPHFHHPEGPTAPGSLLNMLNPEAAVNEEAAKPAKRTAALEMMCVLSRCFGVLWNLS